MISLQCRSNPERHGEDPQILENGYLVDFDHPTLGKVKIPGTQAILAKAGRTTSAAPELGEHTDEILGELCGFSNKEISALREKEVIEREVLVPKRTETPSSFKRSES